MPRPCKTCSSKLRDDIDQYIVSGISFYWLKNWCYDKGLDITETSLKHHAKSHIKGYEQLTRTHEVKEVSKSGFNQNDPNPLIINIDNLPINLDSLQDNIEKTQSIAIELHLISSTILIEKLKAFSNGESKYPNEQIRGHKIIFDIYSRSLGLETFIDENMAIKTLESLGYKIQKTIDITND
jgi:hypothetical protein